jgi:GDP-4-dehydro-6-deoxy-D-mannose reductase
VDLCQPEAVESLLADIRPDRIVHLAGQAFVPRSLEAPWETLETNLRSQLNLFESLRRLHLSACRVLVVSSAHVYGRTAPEETPLREDQAFRPDTPYGVSKVGQDMLAYQYYVAYGLHTLRARPFNHIGVGQDLRFAIPNFAQQIAHIEQTGAEPIIRVGNLAAQRDFTDVRDVVRAYALLLERGTAGEAYNVCSGQAVSMQSILQTLCDLSPAELRIEVDPSRLRPLEVPLVVGDAAKLKKDTGWTPEIALRQSLSDILDAARHAFHPVSPPEHHNDYGKP